MAASHLSHRVSALSLCLLAATVFSCSRDERSTERVVLATEKEPLQTAQDTSSETRQPQRVQLERTEQAGQVALSRETDRSQGSLLPLRQSARFVPEDFEIGPLQDRSASDQDTRRAVAALDSLLKSLAAKEIDETKLLPTKRRDISLTLQYHIDRGNLITRHRIGAIRVREGEDVRVRVRLFGGPGATDGDVYLTQRGGSWYVSDIQIALQLLQEPYIRAQERFLPDVYRWVGRDR